MSGHSKWKNIMHKKEKTDLQRAKVFTKVGREITVAVRESGSADPSVNFRLADIIAKAKANNVPNDNIDRLLKKLASGAGGENYERIVYEGYGPSGVAVIVETLTDNRNRTAGEMRHYFDKNGGNMGQSGCVAFMFASKGVIIIENSGLNEDKVMEDCLNAGAADFSFEDEALEVFTTPEDLNSVRDILKEAGYTFLSAQTEEIPSTYVTLTDEEHIKLMTRLLDMLEENDDVQNVWHNGIIN